MLKIIVKGLTNFFDIVSIFIMLYKTPVFLRHLFI